MNKGVVRSSKFRHVFGKTLRKEDHYENIQSNVSAQDSNLCDANAKYFAVPWRGGGGPFVVWPLNKPGRLPQNVPLVAGHGAQVTDLHFSPFHQECIASASDDTTAKIWKFPEDGPTKTIEEAQVTLAGHYKKIILVRWNSVADNVLATISYDNSIKIWDVNSGKAMNTCEDHPDAIHAFDWNYNGSLYGTYCKDKMARIIDPRANRVVTKYNGHQGLKGARFTFLGDRPMFATIGFSKQSERQIFFWDQRSPDSPLTEVQLDIASGSLLPIFDPDTNMLFLAGKGDTTIRYFEIEDTEPYQHFVNQFQAKEPQRGVAVISKRAVDVANNEIIRVLRLTQNSMEPVCFEVPRKGEHFHLDLYPDTFAGKPSLTSKDWFSGKNAAPVILLI